MLKEHKKNYSVVPTPQDSEQDFFYYVNKEDEDEALESLGYNPRCGRTQLGCGRYVNSTQEDDFRVNKFW